MAQLNMLTSMESMGIRQCSHKPTRILIMEVLQSQSWARRRSQLEVRFHTCKCKSPAVSNWDKCEVHRTQHQGRTSLTSKQATTRTSSNIIAGACHIQVSPTIQKWEATTIDLIRRIIRWTSPIQPKGCTTLPICSTQEPTIHRTKAWPRIIQVTTHKETWSVTIKGVDIKI